MNYNTLDYNSPMGINTRVWGPIQWQFMHMISFNYPVNPTDDDKKFYYEYIKNLQHILPCKSCRSNLSNNLKVAKFTIEKLKNRYTFSKFVYDLHNVVNVMLGRKIYLTYEKVRDRYELFRATCAPETSNVEIGCTIPVNKIKSRCVINIVPLTRSLESFSIDKRCLPKTSRKTSKKTSRKTSKKYLKK
jgi:hypothetical protein